MAPIKFVRGEAAQPAQKEANKGKIVAFVGFPLLSHPKCNYSE